MEYSYFLRVLSKEYYFHLVDRHSLIHSDFVMSMGKAAILPWLRRTWPSQGKCGA